MGSTMDIMVVKDVMRGKDGTTILTGPLLLKDVARRSDVEKAFGQRVGVSSAGGAQLLVPVKGVTVSQAMSGAWQVSVAVEVPADRGGVALDSRVVSER
jgi:hypothetical protein